MRLTIDASQSDVKNTISISNDGAGHITGSISGDPDGGGPLNVKGVGFFNVSTVEILGGPGGTAVSYSQTGAQVFGPGLVFVTSFAENTNSFAADFHGNALTAGAVYFSVYTAGGNDNISFNAAGVNIGPLASLDVSVVGNANDTLRVPEGQTSVSMDYSGVNRSRRGGLYVGFDGDNDAHDVLRLDATFLGSPPAVSLPGRGANGAAPGALSLTGGAGDNQMEMLLSSPGGLSVTGDVFGRPDAAHNSCLRTSNVHSHNCKPDHVLSLKSLPKNNSALPILPF
jgi:hypothetical protein